MRSLRDLGVLGSVMGVVSAALVLSGCAAPPSSFEGPVGKLVERSASANGVPADLMAAMAHVEGGLRLPMVRDVHEDDLVQIAGVLEIRHGGFDSLGRGAELTGRPAVELSRDLEAGTEAGARVLADLAREAGIDRSDLAAWAPIVERMSGHRTKRDREDYRARVFKVLANGGALRARGGETITLAPHSEIPFELTITPPTARPLDTPEFAGAEWFPTEQTDKWTPGRDGNPVTMIAIHDTEGGWDASVSTLQFDPNKSVHYIIDADGSRVGQFIHEADTGWHAGNWHYNQHMIGIEHVGFAGEDDYQTALYEKSAELVRDIAVRWGLGPNGDGTGLDRSVLVGHQEIPDGNVIPSDSPPCPDSPGTCVKSDAYGGASNHRDPGIYWEWCQYTEIIGDGAKCKCNDGFSLWNCVHDNSEAVRCKDGVIEYQHCKNHSCIVEPIGTDDHCGEIDEGTGGGGVGGGGVGGGAAGGPDIGVGGLANGGEGGGGSGGAKASSKGSGCSVPVGETGSDEGRLAVVMLGIGAAMWRRRRSRG